MSVLPTVLLSALVSAGERGDAESAPAPVPAYVHCTPGSYRVAGEPEQRATHPIARALERAGPGTPIYLDPGDYRAFTIGLESSSKANARTSGGLANLMGRSLDIRVCHFCLLVQRTYCPSCSTA